MHDSDTRHDSVQEPTPGPVTIPRELFDFLMGVGEIDGASFGDLNGKLPGRFWWRALLLTAERSSALTQPMPNPTPYRAIVRGGR